MAISNDLSGLLVVSVEQAVAAPYTSSRLADAGARVIKVERQEGDFARYYDDYALGHSAYFVWLNRGKESLVLDLKAKDDSDLLLRILAQADIFLQNLRPGAMDKIGLDGVLLREKNPKLITCSISGFGTAGPKRDKRAYDLIVQGESGLCSITGGPESPARVGVSVCDISAGMYAYAAILEALVARADSGQGRNIEVSLFDSIVDWMTVPLLQHVYGKQTVARHGVHHATVAPYGAYHCAAGRLLIICVQNDRDWVRFCEQVLEQPKLTRDLRFSDNPARVRNRPALDFEINQVCSLNCLMTPWLSACPRQELRTVI